MNMALRLLAIIELSQAMNISLIEARKILWRLSIEAKQNKGGI